MKTESSEKMDLCAFTQILHNSQGGCAPHPDGGWGLGLTLPAEEGLGAHSPHRDGNSRLTLLLLGKRVGRSPQRPRLSSGPQKSKGMGL